MKSLYLRACLGSAASILTVVSAQPVQAQDKPADQAATAPPTSQTSDIVVTAQKYEQRLQDVPVPVSVVNPQTLAQTGQVRLLEYSSTVPGLTISPSGTTGNQENIVIRGISSGGSTNSTVGITIDDIPFGSNFSFAGNVTPDFDPSDLARVEVLRGPQGTLYGASSMGGLIKFVTVDPSTAGFSGRIESDLNGVKNGAEAGYGLRGAINIPVSSDFAVRASGFVRRDAGYIDNPTQSLTGVNEGNFRGGRLSALWSPSDAFKLKLSALYQYSKNDSVSEIDRLPGLGDLQQSTIINCCALDRKLQAYSATITSRLDGVDLTSLTGYNISNYNNSLDYTYLLGGVSNSVYGVRATRYEFNGKTQKFTQELRASIPIGQSINWLIAGFYQNEKSDYVITIPVVNPTTGAKVGSLADFVLPYRFREFAVFSDLTVDLGEKFNVQLGGRYSFLNQGSNATTLTGVIFPGGSTFQPTIRTKPKVFTFQVTPQYKFSSNFMVYARIASGYRQGENNVPVAGISYPASSTPDRTVNYEIGAKGSLFNNALSFDVSAFLIDWKDIQLKVRVPNTAFGYTTNGSQARSEGLELTLDARPLPGLTLRGWYAYTDAKITKDFPATATIYGRDGTRLPFSARHSAYFAINQDISLGGGLTGSIGGQASYVGERIGTFQATAVREIYPAYTKFDLRAGLRYQDWSATIYANNITDKRGVLGGGLGNYPPYGYYYIQPRTVGLSVARKF